MPSRADRPALERLLRGLASLALAALVARTFLLARAGEEVRRVDGTGMLARALERALEPGAPALDVTLDTLPPAATRAVARAVAATGTPVRWREAPGAPLPRLGAVLEPVADPEGRTRLTILGGGAGAVALHDEAGALDSARLSAAGVRVLEALTGEVVRTRVARGGATVSRRDSVLVRPVLVVGRAGWEGKFVVAALEEAGWRVDARLAVAPGAEVRQGPPAPIDTARYAAVVALDATIAPLVPSLSRYVRSGGGLVVLPDAAGVAALDALLPASPGDAIPALPGALLSAEPRRGLGGVALVRVRAQAERLEVDRGAPRMAAARVALGRVLLSGYRDSWRWRMEGDDAAPAAHRAWWNAIVTSVAYAPLVARAGAAWDADDPAPFAALVDALGAPRPVAADDPPRSAPWPWDAILLALFIVALLTEWGSRRLRGAR